MKKIKLTVGLLLITIMVGTAVYDFYQETKEQKENKALWELIMSYQEDTKIDPVTPGGIILLNTSSAITDYMMFKGPDYTPISQTVVPVCAFLILFLSFIPVSTSNKGTAA